MVSALVSRNRTWLHGSDSTKAPVLLFTPVNAKPNAGKVASAGLPLAKLAKERFKGRVIRAESLEQSSQAQWERVLSGEYSLASFPRLSGEALRASPAMQSVARRMFRHSAVTRSLSSSLNFWLETFDNRSDDASTGSVLDGRFVCGKRIRDMLVIFWKKHHRKIPRVESVAGL